VLALRLRLLLLLRAPDTQSCLRRPLHVPQVRPELGGLANFHGGPGMSAQLRVRYRPYEEDMLIAGKGGSGKTHLVMKGLMKAARYNCWVWDYRWQYDRLRYEGFAITHDLPSLPYGRAVYQPRDKSVDAFDAFCAKAERWDNLVIVVEEAHRYAGKYKIRSDSFAAIVNAGRPHGVTWICITRRPQQLHNDILADADHVFVFEHDLPGDIKYLQTWVGAEVQMLLPPEQRTAFRDRPKLPEHSFVYKNLSTGEIQVGRL
jgi:hypothetical protein